MHQSGGLQNVAGRLLGHFLIGKPPQIFVDEGKEFGGGFGAALLDAFQHDGGFAPVLTFKESIAL
jgi:hypothetical protein